MRLEQTSKTNSDCSASFDVCMDGAEHTVYSLILDILEDRQSWGSIHIKDFLQHPLKYSGGDLLDTLPKGFYDKKVVSATCHGGYSSMNYYISIE